MLDSRRLGGAWILDRVWERLGSARRSAGSPPGGARIASRSSGWCSRCSRQGVDHPATVEPGRDGWNPVSVVTGW